MTPQTEIKPIGGYIYPDSDGYLVNPTSISHIPKKWLRLTEDLTDAYIKVYDDNLHSVYIRGSVAQGTMISGVSDLDSFCLVRNQVTENEDNCLQLMVNKIAAKYPFANGIEALAFTVDEALTNESYKFLIKILALCVWGEEVGSKIGKYQVSVSALDFCTRINDLNQRFLKYATMLKDDNEARRYCVSISKLALRIAFDIVMLREARFTRDLYYCWESYAKYYPQHASLLKEFLDHAVNPIADTELILKKWGKLCSLLQEQIDNAHHLRI